MPPKITDLKVFGSRGGFPALFLAGGAIPAAGGSRRADTASPCPRGLHKLIPAVSGRRQAILMYLIIIHPRTAIRYTKVRLIRYGGTAN